MVGDRSHITFTALISQLLGNNLALDHKLEPGHALPAIPVIQSNMINSPRLILKGINLEKRGIKLNWWIMLLTGALYGTYSGRVKFWNSRHPPLSLSGV